MIIEGNLTTEERRQLNRVKDKFLPGTATVWPGEHLLPNVQRKLLSKGFVPGKDGEKEVIRKQL